MTRPLPPTPPMLQLRAAFTAASTRHEAEEAA